LETCMHAPNLGISNFYNEKVGQPSWWQGGGAGSRAIRVRNTPKLATKTWQTW
jgi:hypothetical protein